MSLGMSLGMRKILALSCCCADVFPEQSIVYIGGNALNLAVICAKSKEAVSVYVAGNVGTDSYGSEIKAIADKYNINRDKLIELPGETAYNLVYLTESGDRYFKEGSWSDGVYNSYRIHEEDETFLSGFDAVASTYNDSVFADLIRFGKAKQGGQPPLISMDFMEHTPIEKWREYLPSIDLFFISGKPEYFPLLQQWSREFPGIIFTATLGAQGSIAFQNGSKYQCEAVKVSEVIDTTGCGDAFQGAFIVDYLHHRDISSAMKAGSKSAAITLSHMGAIQ